MFSYELINIQAVITRSLKILLDENVSGYLYAIEAKI